MSRAPDPMGPPAHRKDNVFDGDEMKQLGRDDVAVGAHRVHRRDPCVRHLLSGGSRRYTRDRAVRLTWDTLEVHHFDIER
jgi:hypothetical protein